MRAVGSVVERTHAADTAGTGSLVEIEHVVLLMQENRSFGHYYGTIKGSRLR
jgi:phospholipase C